MIGLHRPEGVYVGACMYFLVAESKFCDERLSNQITDLLDLVQGFVMLSMH